VTVSSKSLGIGLGAAVLGVTTLLYIATIFWVKPGCPMKLKHADVPDSEFDPEQLRIGMAVETEHSDNPACAEAIAKAHLLESADYYRKLARMERTF